MAARDHGWPEGTHEKWWQEEIELFEAEKHKEQADLVLPAGTTLDERLKQSLDLILRHLDT